MAVVTTAVAMRRQWQGGTVMLLSCCLAIITVLGRAHAAEKRREEGPLGALVYTPHVMTVPVGAARTLTARWVLAMALAWLATFHAGMPTIVIVIAVAVFNMVRAAHSFLRTPVSHSAAD